MNKKLFFTFIFIFLIGGFLYFNYNSTQDTEWTTYQKKEDQIKSYPSTPEELVHVPKMSNRKQSSVAKNFTLMKKDPPKWQKEISSQILKFQDINTKVLVYPLKTLFHKNRQVEKVIVTILKPNEVQNSATILVNSQTGRIINSWNRTIHEHMHKKKDSLTPTNL